MNQCSIHSVKQLLVTSNQDLETLITCRICKLNTDSLHNKCSDPEEVPEDIIPLGKKSKKEDLRTCEQVCCIRKLGQFYKSLQQTARFLSTRC